MNKLRFNLKLKPHPYPKDPSASSEKWGSIAILILASEGEKLLLEWEWNLIQLAVWFAENEEFLNCDTLSANEMDLFPLPSESLAQAINRLREQDFPEGNDDLEEQWHSTLLEFREHHSLRFALRGTDVPEIIIGCNRGVGEISLSTEDEEWSYSFDMADFLSDIRNKIEDFLPKWILDQS